MTALNNFHRRVEAAGHEPFLATKIVLARLEFAMVDPELEFRQRRAYIAEAVARAELALAAAWAGQDGAE